MITSDFFSKNRQRVCNRLRDNMLVLSAYDAMQQTNDSAGPFVQESSFWWLTGLELPGWRLLLDGKSGKASLVPPTLSETEKLFDSYYSNDEAISKSGVDECISEDALWDQVKGRQVYALRPMYAKQHSFTLNPAPTRLWRQVKKHATCVDDAWPLLAVLRAVKQPEEVAAIERAIDITVEAFTAASAKMSTYTHEAEIAADMTQQIMCQQASHAYAPIIASGKNACTLHYVRNEAPLQGLVLMDVGAKYNGYSADITRTYAGQAPTARQRDVHQAVQYALRAIVKYIAPGVPIKEYVQYADRCMQDALIDLGLLSSRQDTKTYRKYFPHAISHGLGVDVHDSLGGAKVFAEGMILTVEPGIYIPEEGVGVRIEDDILITKSGRKNLTEHLPIVL